MTNYETNTWYGWNGGECPVHPKTQVEAIEEIGVRWTALADECDWRSFKGAFRVVKPYVAPLECRVAPLERWVVIHGNPGAVGGIYYTEAIAKAMSEGHPDARVALFREVTEGGDANACAIFAEDGQ